MFLPPKKPQKGITRRAENIRSSLYTLRRYIGASDAGPNQMAQIAMQQTRQEVRKALDRVNLFFEKQWPSYQKRVEEAQVSIFKPVPSIKME
jgi:hypothetical protein